MEGKKMKVWKRNVMAALIVLVLCGLIGTVFYRIGNDNGYVDGWIDGKITEHLYTKFMDDCENGEHLIDEDIENEIGLSYILYTYNERPTAQQAKHLFNLLYEYVFWGVKSRE